MENLRFKVDNLGVLGSGEIELKPLTLVTGPNNSGKTYLTYALYGFLSKWQNYVHLPPLENFITQDAGTLSLDLAPFLERRQARVDAALKRYTSGLGSVFASPAARFESARLSLTIPSFAEATTEGFVARIRGPRPETRITAEYLKEEARLVVSTQAAIAPELTAGLIAWIHDRIVEVVFEATFPRTFIFSTERTGAITFRAERDLINAQVVRAVGQFDPVGGGVNRYLKKVRESGYPLPVRDNDDFLKTLGTIVNFDSEIATKHPELMAEFDLLAGGTYRVTSTGDPEFIPKDKKSVKLKMQEVSSSVRSLLMMAFYLKHQAAPGDLVIMDEPELNLHVENQRRMARLVARLVNAGVRFLITTHSDTFVREINSLVVLRGLGEVGEEVRSASGYGVDEGLAASDVGVSILKQEPYTPHGKKRKTTGICLSEVPIDPRFGMERTTFDATLIEIIDVQSILFAAAERSGVAFEE